MLNILCPRTDSIAAGHLKKQIRWLLFFRVLFLSLMLGISAFLQTEERQIFLPALHYIAYFIAGIYLLTIASALVLRRIQCYGRFGYLQIFLDCVLVTLLVFFTGGSQSVFLVVYFFPIVMGAFMLFQRGGLLFAAICTLFHGTLLLLEYYGIASRSPLQEASPLVSLNIVLHYFSIHGLTFFLVAILSARLSVRLQKTEAELFRTVHDYDRLSFLYKQIFDDISTGIITVDEENRITSFNRAAELITGYSATEMLNRHINEKFSDLQPVAAEAERPVISIARKDGEVIPLGYSWAKLNMPDNRGNCRVYTLQDLSRIREMEARVQQAEKMATIGEMAAGIAHELRNPLAAISGAVQLLHKDVRDEPVEKRLFSIVMRECDRLEQTVADFLLFSKPVMPEKEWFSLAGCARESLDILRHNPKWDPSPAVAVEIPDDLDCWGDPQLIRQVFLNLVGNSVNACRHGREASIVIRGRESSGADQETVFVEFQVEDNGHGIPEKLLDRIFTPFFTTRENGTGLGLAIVRQIVESHGGSIVAENRAEGGAVFTVRLPLP